MDNGPKKNLKVCSMNVCVEKYTIYFGTLLFSRLIVIFLNSEKGMPIALR
jgi:hypothetical protein